MRVTCYDENDPQYVVEQGVKYVEEKNTVRVAANVKIWVKIIPGKGSSLSSGKDLGKSFVWYRIGVQFLRNKVSKEENMRDKFHGMIRSYRVLKAKVTYLP